MAESGSICGATARGDGGFSLVEILVACLLLALALVPAMRALNANARMAAMARAESAKAIADADSAAREAVESDAAVSKNGGR